MIWTIISLGIVRVKRNLFALLCQTLALTAILIPLMLIFGLKYGIVSSLKEELLKNPTMLEVRPTEGVEISNEAFRQIKSWKETEFVLPAIGAAYSSVCIGKDSPVTSSYPTYTLISTAPGDPILNKNKIKPPTDNEVVITEPLARAENIKVQDKVILTAWRNSNKERFDYAATVVGILPAAYSKHLRQIYAPHNYTYEAELFLTTGKGKKLQSPRITGACYNGIVSNTKLPEPMESLAAHVSRYWTLTTAEKAGLPYIDGALQVLHSPVNRLTANDVNTLILHAKSHGIEAYPWVDSFTIKLPNNLGGNALTIVPMDTIAGHADTCPSTPVMYVNPAQRKEDSAIVEINTTSSISSSIRLQFVAEESVPENIAYVAPQLAALLWSATQKAIVWDYAEGIYYQPLASYCHMRLYAKNLESVEPLLNKVRDLGIPSVANIFAIKRVFALERSLHNLFLIISAGAGIGAAISFTLSLFNAAELHRSDYAIIQLMGCNRITLVFLPFIDAFTTALSAFFLSWGFFSIIASLIGCMFADTAGGDVVCRLEPSHLACFGVASISLAFLAACVAALKVLSVTPSEIIRES